MEPTLVRTEDLEGLKLISVTDSAEVPSGEHPCNYNDNVDSLLQTCPHSRIRLHEPRRP